MVFSGISRKNSGNARIETASENGGQSFFLKTILISPLPAIFKLSLVFRLVVRRIQIIHPTFQASIHNRQVLIGQSHIHNNIGLKRTHQGAQFGNIVGIHSRRLYPVTTDRRCNLVALRFRAARQHNIGK